MPSFEREAKWSISLALMSHQQRKAMTDEEWKALFCSSPEFACSKGKITLARAHIKDKPHEQDIQRRTNPNQNYRRKRTKITPSKTPPSFYNYSSIKVFIERLSLHLSGRSPGKSFPAFLPFLPRPNRYDERSLIGPLALLLYPFSLNFPALCLSFSS